ncbi:MAG: hypothetical protein HY696_00440 [Deltaproteobacteria bacterium]|nr:hypothetical protein [Deltaproteobacteria bacterium]
MESIGDLIEKLVIANLKLWLVKDAQTALACRTPPDREALHTALSQLTRVEGESADGVTALRQLVQRLDALAAHAATPDVEELRRLVQKDIELCEVRAALRREISTRLADPTPSDTVKQYGK